MKSIVFIHRGAAFFMLVFQIVLQLHAEPRSSSDQPKKGERVVYELTDQNKVVELLVLPDVQPFSANAINNDGKPSSRPDPILMKLLKENALSTRKISAPTEENVVSKPRP